MSLTIKQLKSIAISEAVVTHGKEMMAYIPPALADDIAGALVKAGAVDSKEAGLAMVRSDSGRLSLMSSDYYNSIVQKYLEQYDKEMDEAILCSENIVEAYNKFIEGKFEEAAKSVDRKIAESQETYEQPIFNALEMMAAVYIQYVQLGVDEKQLRKYCIENSFYTSDDPEDIKRAIKMRTNYANTMIKLFQGMLNENYQLLGFSKDEALLLSQQMTSGNADERGMSIKTMKSAVEANKSKFDKGKGFIDLRPLGGAVFFGTPEETGLEKFINIESMLQTAMRYDCIVFGHGDTLTKEDAKKYQEHFEKKYNTDKLFEGLDDQIKKDVKDFNDKLARIKSKAETDDRYARILSAINKSKSDDIEAVADHFERRMEKLDKHIRKKQGELADLYGDVNNRDKQAKLKREIKKLEEKWARIRATWMAYRDQYWEVLETEVKDDSSIDEKLTQALGNDNIKKVREISNKYFSELEDEWDELVEEISDHARGEGESNEGRRWVIQPVYTEKAGPFTDMNDLIRQCIKEGYKNINVVSCNPGHHELDPDIKKIKGVHIHHSTNTLLAESVIAPMYGVDFDFNDSLDEASQILFEAEQDLIRVCNEEGINYYDDEFLDEAVTDFSNLNFDSLNEASARKVWETIKSLVKKAVAFVVGIFKKIISFFKGIIEKIKNFFEKIFKSGKIEKPLRKKFTAKFIILEGASIRATQIGNWDDLQKQALDSCTRIANRIKRTEGDHNKWLREAERYAEQMEKKSDDSRPTNESVLSRAINFFN